MVRRQQQLGPQAITVLAHQCLLGLALDITGQQQRPILAGDPQHAGRIVALPMRIRCRVQYAERHTVPAPLLTGSAGTCEQLEFVHHRGRTATMVAVVVGDHQPVQTRDAALP